MYIIELYHLSHIRSRPPDGRPRSANAFGKVLKGRAQVGEAVQRVHGQGIDLLCEGASLVFFIIFAWFSYERVVGHLV